MDEKLAEIDGLINDMKCVLKKFGQRKRVRPSMRDFDVKTELKQIRSKWFNAFDEIFHSLGSQTIYDKVADELIRGLSTAKIQYKPDDNTYKAVYECITIPIIALIMDEQEMSQKSFERQERRKCFIQHLINFKPLKEDAIEVINILDDSNDVATPVKVDDFRFESIFVLSFLIDALHRHSKAIKPKDLNIFVREIYHIINITHITTTVSKYLEDLNQYALDRCSNSCLHSWDFEAKAKVIRELERFEAIIKANCESFDIDHYLVIYRFDLSLIKSRIRSILSTLKRRVDE